MGQRVYTAQFHNVSVSAIQDLLSIKAGSANGVEVHYVSLTATGQTTPSEFDIQVKRLPATVTAGSGGSAPTMAAVDDGDTKSATATVRANDTTQATTSGTAVTCESEYWNVLLPYNHMPAPEDRYVLQASEELVWALSTAPGSATTLAGTIKWRELP